MRYGLQINDDVGIHVGLVHEIKDEFDDYYILGKGSYCDCLRKDCMKLIEKYVYDFLLPRNTVILKWINEMDVPFEQLKLPVILFRESLVEPNEIKAASKYFSVYTCPSEVPHNRTVIGRYSVLPFYDLIEKDFQTKDCKFINSHEQHRYIADFQYYHDVEDLTFKTWFNAHELPEDEAPFVIKGKTNSRKSDWNGCMFAKTKRAAIEQGCELQKDSLIGQQDIIYRKYIPLETYEIGVNGLPFTNEWRIFVYEDSIVSVAYYWSNAENAEYMTMKGPTDECIDFALRVINRLKNKLNFYVIDLARTAGGEWILVEVNDAQMSGLSMTKPEMLYSKLAEIAGAKNG